MKYYEMICNSNQNKHSYLDYTSSDLPGSIYSLHVEHRQLVAERFLS